MEFLLQVKMVRKYKMTNKKKPTFLRRVSERYAKLGKGVKKNKKWRRPTGRDNKMRDKRRGYPAVVSVGYKTDVISRGKIKEKQPVKVMNLKDLEKIKTNQIAIIGKIGKKKKIELAKKAKEMKIEIYNLNPKSYLKKNEKKKIVHGTKSPTSSAEASSNENKKTTEAKK